MQSNFITEDTEILAAQANERSIAATVELAQEATRFDGVELPADVARKLKLLKLALTLPAPSDAREDRRADPHRGVDGRPSTARGKYCPPGKRVQGSDRT